MVGIPPALDSDAEDVAWALQTAEALWKRNERVDAIVWLRRAAQAAGEAEDDDRALTLARGAAELAEWIAQTTALPTTSSLPPSHRQPGSTDAVEDLLRRSQVDIEVAVAEGAPSPSSEAMSIDLNAVEDTLPPERPAPPPERPPPPPEPREPTRDLPPLEASDVETTEETLVPIGSAVPPPQAPQVEVHTRPHSVPDAEPPTAAEAHAGMLDPWADSEKPTARRDGPTADDAPAPPPPQPPSGDDVVTSAPSAVSAVVRSGRPPPLPPRPAPAKTPAPPAAPTEAPTPAARAAALDLGGVEAFADLPDDARSAFASAAKVESLGRDDQVATFALALVLEGSVDVAAAIVDAPAQRLEAGAVLRSRGTLEHRVPMRLICASDRARVATWGDDAVDEAFRACSWVEDDLRAAGNRVQALVGLTMGPLGERLDAGLREQVTGRLAVRVLEEGEVFAEQGTAIPGLLVVGVGDLDLVREGAVHLTLGSGEFLFASEVIGGGRAPSTARAGKGGALVMIADRQAAQELLVTCPPLLEIFAGM